MNRDNVTEKSKAPTYEEQLRDLYNSKKFDEALQLVINEEQKQPQAPKILAAKATLFGILGKYKESIDAANEALSLNANDFELLNTKGVSLYCLEKYDEAIKVFNACLILKPNFPIATQKKISALTILKRYAEAAKVYEESDLPDLQEEIWLNNLGFIYIELSNYRRANLFLYRAARTNPFEYVIYYNLALSHKTLKNYFSYLLYRFLFLSLYALDKIGLLKRVRQSYNNHRNHISEAKFFDGPGKLFSSDSQIRETRSILKLLRDINATALCNDTWQWFAVNIPYEAVEKNGLEGDIDILLKRPRFLPGSNYDAGFTYRAFEVKTVIVDRNGNVKSAKRGEKKHQKIKKQLDKLKEFGCEQVFLLELFVLERGYSSRNNFPSDAIKKEILEKAQYLQKLGYGYVVMAEEPSTTHDDESGGVMHFPINVLRTTNNPLGSHFQKLVDGIDGFLENETTKDALKNLSQHDQFGTKVGYCISCKKLTMFAPVKFISHECIFCKKPVY
jgi:tetratricopeptide (TPR) repeat protein